MGESSEQADPSKDAALATGPDQQPSHTSATGPISLFQDIGLDYVLQPQSRLLSLPSELRNHIYSYFTLSPLSTDFPDWQGVYFASRQLHWEIRGMLSPEKALDEIKGLIPMCSHSLPTGPVGLLFPFASAGATTTAFILTTTPAFSSFRLLQNVSIQIGVATFARCLDSSPAGCSMITQLYGCYLKRLHIVLVGNPVGSGLLPYGDMKSMDNQLLGRYVAEGIVNCAAITFTLKALTDPRLDQKKSTTLENKFLDSGVPYQLTILQEKNGRQSERSYSSATRFKTPLIKAQDYIAG